MSRFPESTEGNLRLRHIKGCLNHFYAVWIEIPTKCIPVCDGHHPTYSPLVVRTGTSEQYRDIFEVQQGHFEHIRCILTLVRDADITNKLKRCKFSFNSINHSGDVIQPRLVTVTQHTIDTLCDLISFTIITERRKLLGLSNFFLIFVLSFCSNCVAI